MLLENIHSPEDLKSLTIDQLRLLAGEIRTFLYESVRATGGHFGANMGVVELTLALHTVFDSPRDKIIWDVGHQSYVHKLLTGRQDGFRSLRMYGGMSGFPKRSESEHDAFGVGHSSTSISAAVGMAVARDLKGENFDVVAVIGDGAMTGGMAFEAMNHVGHTKTDLIVVLNDNDMSIDANVGAMSHYLSRLRTDPSYTKLKAEVHHLLKRIPWMGDRVASTVERMKDSLKYLMVPGMLFEEIGFTYLGPIDGHDLPLVTDYLKQAKQMTGPVLLHVITQKGKGFTSAEEAPDKLHAFAPPKPRLTGGPKPQYADVFAGALTELARQDDRIVAVTPAMLSGSKLTKFAEVFPNRCFDVGIAEQHAATFCAGLATQGMRPVLAIYSTFMQRAYDQIIHDIAIQSLPVVIAVDRAGIVGQDGETHQGVFDIAYLRAVPNLTIMNASNENELRDMLYTALELNGPVAVRYPRADGLGLEWDGTFRRLPVGTAQVLREGTDVAILGTGTTVELAKEAAQELERHGIQASVVNLRFVKPLDESMLCDLAAACPRIVTIEETMISGGMGSAVMEALARNGFSGVDWLPIGLADRFIEHGDRQTVLAAEGFTPQEVAEKVRLHFPRIQKRAL